MQIFFRLKVIVLVLHVLQFKAYALPENLEVWFISPDTSTGLIFPSETLSFSSLLAQARPQCQKMGEYCFDPQIGLYRPGESGKISDIAANYESVDKLENYKEEREAIGEEWKESRCDDSGFFSLFCSQDKATITSNKTKLEIWIDTSSTMRQVDFAGHDQTCERLALLNKIENKCRFNQDYKLYVFDEVKKEAGQKSQVCFNIGLNHRDRLITEIKASKAKNLVIITDIFEADSVLINVIESHPAGVIRGLDTPLYAKDLKGLANNLAQQCL